MRIFAYLLKDIRIFLKSRSSVVLSYLVPMVIIFIFGTIFGGMGKNSGISSINVLCANEDNSEFSDTFITEIDKLSEITILKKLRKGDQETAIKQQEMDDLITKGKYGVGLLIPSGFEERVKAGDSLKLEIHYDPKFAVEYGIVSGMIQKTIPTKFPQLMLNSLWKSSEQALGSDRNQQFKKSLTGEVKKYFPDANISERETIDLKPVTASEKDTLSGGFDMFSGMLSLKAVELVGEKVENKMFSQYVAGMAVMFLLFSINGTAGSLLNEKKNGTLKRLLISPAKPMEILSGKMLFCILLGMSQLIVLFIFGWLVFKLNIFRDIPSLLIVMLATSLACTSLGIFLATICKTERQIDSLSTLIVLTMSSLGGSMVPSFFMPVAIQNIGKFTINYWSMKGFTDIFWRNLTFMEIMPSVLILVVAAIVMTLSARYFYNKRLFD